MEADLLRRAITLAQPTHPHPNPRVGAVIADESGIILGEGWHVGPGADHAEVVALRAAGPRAKGATVYVTLEPCSHHGRTPPCVDALLEAEVARVVVGVLDPDPRVKGRGCERLREAGVEVIEGVVSRAEAESLDPGYFHHRKTGRPRVTFKAAATLDGSTAARDLTSQWITSAEAREDGHRLRAAADAVMVGAGTLLADDPRLDVRLDEYRGPQPRPVVVAGTRPLPFERAAWRPNALVLATDQLTVPAEVVVVPGDEHGHVDLLAAMLTLGDLGIVDVLVEGGAVLIGALWRARLVSRGILYLGAKVGGGSGIPIAAGPFATLGDAQDVTVVDVRSIGPDVRIEFLRKDD